jgi:hypothetical protein
MTTDYDLILVVQHLLILVGWLLGLVSLIYSVFAIICYFCDRWSDKKYRKVYLKYERSCLVWGVTPRSYRPYFTSPADSVESLLHQTLLNEERVKAQRLKLATYHLGRAAGLNHNDPRKVALFTSCMEAVTLLNQKYSKK